MHVQSTDLEDVVCGVAVWLQGKGGVDASQVANQVFGVVPNRPKVHKPAPALCVWGWVGGCKCVRGRMVECGCGYECGCG